MKCSRRRFPLQEWHCPDPVSKHLSWPGLGASAAAIRKAGRLAGGRYAVFLVLWLASLGCSSSPLEAPELNRRLIVTTDDAGMCANVNHGTFEALNSGVVTSASIMVPCPAFRDFAEFAVAHPEYDYGVHLTLTCDLPEHPWGPMLSAELVPSLVDDSGLFRSSTAEVAMHAEIQDVERELRAQIEAAIAAGIRVTHIDHHMWVLHTRRDFLELYATLAVDYGLPARMLRNPPALDSAELVEAYQSAANRMLDAGLPLLDSVLANNYTVEPGLKRSHYLTTIRSTRFGLSELVVHCAFAAPDSVLPPDASRRAAETQFLCSREAREEMIRSRIRMTTWGSLMSQAPQSRQSR